MGSLLKSCLAELIGTFVIVLFACGSVCMDALTAGALGEVGKAASAGLAVAVMVYCFLPVSGAHFNPAVTLTLFSLRRIEAGKTVFYLAAQLLGAALAALMLSAVLKQYPYLSVSPFYLGAVALDGVGFKAATLIEAVLTFVLLLTIFSTAVDRPASGIVPGLAIGMAVVGAILAAGPLTGAAINPARAFGPAVVTGFWSNWYVYWVGPISGALAAGWIHSLLFLPSFKRQSIS